MILTPKNSKSGFRSNNFNFDSAEEHKIALLEHQEQIDSLIIGLKHLKVGGTLCYTTQSLLNIENEAVVATVLKYFGDSIQIQEPPQNLKFTPGATQWSVVGPNK